jgi:DNA-binding response OmpR family regulator
VGKRILVVDHDANNLELVKLYLKRDNHILNLRHKISAAGNQSLRLKTVYGIGYKLVTDAAGKLS